MSKDTTIQIRVDSDARRQIQQLAESRYLSVSALVRAWILDRLKQELETSREGKQE